MHYSVLVICPPVPIDALEKEVTRLMAPHEEWYSETDDDSYGGEWDYWRIGGRWAGMLTVHPDALRVVGEKSWEWGFGDDPEPWPNDDPLRCDGARKPDVDFEAIAMRQIAEARETWAHRDEPMVWLRKEDTEESLIHEASHFTTYAVVTEEHGWEARQRYNPDSETFDETEGWASVIAARIRKADPDAWLVICDAHS